MICYRCSQIYCGERIPLNGPIHCNCSSVANLPIAVKPLALENCSEIVAPAVGVWHCHPLTESVSVLSMLVKRSSLIVPDSWNQTGLSARPLLPLQSLNRPMTLVLAAAISVKLARRSPSKARAIPKNLRCRLFRFLEI